MDHLIAQSLTHRKQLEQCLEKRAVTPPAERQSARVPMNELLPQLQVQSLTTRS